MPSSDSTVIKAKNVKLLRGRAISRAVCSDESEGGTEERPPQYKKTAREHEQDKWSQIIETVKKESYEKGFADGTASQKQEVASSVAAMAAAVKEVRTLKKRFYAENEKELLDLVLAVAGKVIHKEVIADRGVVLAVLRDAVKKVADEAGLKVRLNPDDLKFITEMKKDILNENEIFRNAVFEGDETIRRGGVLLETEHLAVHVTPEQQLDKIREAFKI
jgi:flagellar assembly protein FliH